MAMGGTFIAVAVHHGSMTMRRTSIAVAAVHYGSMAMGGTSIAVAAVHHKHDRYEAWLWGGPPSRSQRFTIGITGMKHSLAFLREKEGEKEGEKKKEKKKYKYCTL